MTINALRPVRLLATLFVIAAMWVALAPRAISGSTTIVIVAGTSMQPTLQDGDLVLAREQSDYAVGDIVAFDSGRGMVIHRIIGEGEEGFVMQGDNKERPDTWTPSHQEILGKKLIRIPEAGRWVSDLQESPALLGAVVGGLGSLGIWGSRRRSTRQGAHSVERSRRRARARAGNSPMVRGAGGVLAALAAVGLLLAAALVFFLVRPAERLETVEVPLFENTAEFDYTATVAPSIIYGSPSIGPSADGTPSPPIYTQLLRDLQVRFDYAVAASTAADVAGTVSADLRISAGEDGWSRTLELLPPQPFNGSSLSTTFGVEWSTVADLITRAEEQTGLMPSIYQLAAVAEVQLTGEVGQPGADTFVAELPMELTDTQLSISDEALSIAEPTTQSREMLVDNDLEIFGLTVPIREARAVTMGLLAILIVAGGIYAWRVRQRLGTGEVASIRLRYGPLIVPVTGGSPNGTRDVDVATIADLVRLAKRAEQMVFYHQPSRGEHLFFVPDGAVTYRYHTHTWGDR